MHVNTEAREKGGREVKESEGRQPNLMTYLYSPPPPPPHTHTHTHTLSLATLPSKVCRPLPRVLSGPVLCPGRFSGSVWLCAGCPRFQEVLQHLQRGVAAQDAGPLPQLTAIYPPTRSRGGKCISCRGLWGKALKCFMGTVKNRDTS